MCLIGCISATNDTGVDNYKSIPTTSDIQQQDITPTTNTQNEIQTTNKAVESNKDPVASNVNENTNIKMDVNTQTTNTNNTLKSNAKKTADSKTVKQAAQKDTTKVKVTDITSYPGKTVQLKAQITSSKTVNSGTVLFKINGITYGQTSVSNGIATMNYHISSSFKNPTYTITAIYQGNDKFSESRANGTLHLNNVTKTSVKVTSITSYPGKTVQLKAQINCGRTVNIGKVAFKINGKTIGTTNVKNNVATIKYAISSSFKNPTYTITAVYGQYGEFKEARANGTLHLNNVTKTSVKVTSITSYPGKTVQLKAQINSNKAVNTGKVAFKINGKTIGTVNVKNSIATIKYAIPSSFKNPTYTITAVYGQYGEFKESKANGILHLNNVTKTSVKITSITSYPGETIELKAQINCGKTVNTGKVAFKINGKTIGTVNVKNSVATIKYAIPSSFKNSKYILTAVYGQYGEFKEARANGTLYLESSQYKEYLTATKRCDAHSSYFKSIVNSVTSKISGTYNKAVALFNYANNRLRYSSYYNTRYGSTQTCKQAFGNCCDMAHVVIALMRTAGIPARYNHATCYFNSGLVTGHVWAEVYVNGKWYKCDTTSAKNSFGVIRNWYKCGTIKKYKALPF